MNILTTPPHWSYDAVFYHIYPLGFCGAPGRSDFSSPPQPRLDKLYEWLPHLRYLGVNALYIGPLFESSAHGYDTADYYTVDRRLGDNASLGRLADELHRQGIRLVLDAVFNHVGRDFWAFRDVQRNGAASPYCGWFRGLRFEGRSPYGDPFTYEGWSGYYDLVRLDVGNPAVCEHIFGAISTWVEQFGIDGLRLDVAELLDLDFLRALHDFCRTLRPDFWLMGEVVHGDYRRWVNPETLDSVTNYEMYKSLYSSLVEANLFEVAYALNRQFGQSGLYPGLPLYNFADNHDVDRVASKLGDPAHLYPLYLLLFTIPGVPSIYYGSEFGLQAKRTPYADKPLRPCLELSDLQRSAPQLHLPADIARLAELRRNHPALRYGDYQQLSLASEQLAFSRSYQGETLVVLLNSTAAPVRMEVSLPPGFTSAIDVLNGGERFPVKGGKLGVDAVPAHWGCVLKL